MIMPARDEQPHTHTLSRGILSAMARATVMIHNSEDGWKTVVLTALDAEFPDDAEMRAFAEASFSEIVGFLLKGHKVRSACCGMELFAGDE